MIRILAVVCLIWGFNWVVMKTANDYFPPLLFVAWRFSTGALIMLTVAFRKKIPLPDAKFLPWIILTGVLQMSLTNVAVQVGLLSIGAGMGAVLNFTYPLWTAILAHFTLNEKLTRRKLVGIFSAILGLYVLMGVQGVDDLHAALILILGAISLAVTNVIVKLKLNKCNMIQLTTGQLFFGALAMVIYTSLVPQGEISWSATAILCVLYNGALASALAFMLWNYVLVRIEASKASISTLATPVVSVLCGVIFLGEPLTAYIIFGMLLIFAGILIVIRK